MKEPPAIAGPFSGRPSNLKHELRTPLNHIIGYCEMLMEEAQDAGEDEIIRDLERIHLAGRQLLSVINDLFDTDKAAPYDPNNDTEGGALGFNPTFHNPYGRYLQLSVTYKFK